VFKNTQDINMTLKQQLTVLKFDNLF